MHQRLHADRDPDRHRHHGPAGLARGADPVLQGQFIEAEDREGADADDLDGARYLPPGHRLVPGWDGPYMPRDIPDDPWGNPYIYSPEGDNEHPYSLQSYGAGGVPGGEDEEEDIVFQ
jgi:type II secretory pathway pseudopilin PulG